MWGPSPPPVPHSHLLQIKTIAPQVKVICFLNQYVLCQCQSLTSTGLSSVYSWFLPRWKLLGGCKVERLKATELNNPLSNQDAEILNLCL